MCCMTDSALIETFGGYNAWEPKHEAGRILPAVPALRFREQEFIETG